MAAVHTFERIVKRNGLLDLEQPYRLRARQATDTSTGGFFPAPTSTTTEADPSTTTQATSSSDSPSPTTTTEPTPTTTSRDTSTTTSAPDSTTTTSSSETTTTRDRSTTTTDADTTVVSVITPTTVIVVGTSTLTSALDPITSSETRSLAPSSGANSGSGGLSSGAKIGIGVGAGVGGAIVLAILAFACLGLGRKRKNKDDAIVWPAIADSSALYPEPVHNTGRAGFGVGDDGDELEPMPSGEHGHGMAEVGAGAAGVGAAGMLGRYGSMSSHGQSTQPTLPQFPPSVYADQQAYGGYYGSDGPEGASNYTGYSTTTPSQHSHAPLAPGPASIGYGRSQERHSPSPPRTTAGSASNDGHGYEGGGAHMPFPGEPEEELPGRPVSPTPMQVGDTFGSGYDESDGGRRWRLSVVNNNE
ncbi:hypothetical protein JCM10207_001167 [Rhodosporidiobolus poonsookiae]